MWCGILYTIRTSFPGSTANTVENIDQTRLTQVSDPHHFDQQSRRESRVDADVSSNARSHAPFLTAVSIINRDSSARFPEVVWQWHSFDWWKYD